ncbi:MAG: nitronate monooxygenase [Clostridiales bacterium]|jgi:enoyl-[acyl-carrier protein] reductase II|nr:nitronate monooxygenase [Clostridiales bacterium]MDR2713538.1 nitronate monooxygenase [Clostridiales bacterium]
MNTVEFCRALGIRYPIIQGGMAWVSDANLAAAVSNAGGLGLIAGMNCDKEQLRQEIAAARTLTDKPFGVNVMLLSPHAGEVARLVIEEKIPVITTGAGDPGLFMAAWLAAGIKVIPVIPSVALAKRVARMGAFAVVAEGGESGGHIGDLTTMALLPQVCDGVDIPVIAAGGIGDGRGLAAAMILGAAAVQMGTRFMVARECTIDHGYKEKILKASDTGTMVTGRRLGHPVRLLKNAFARELLAKEYDSSISNQELENMAADSLRRAAKEGDLGGGSLLAGQIAGLIKKEQTAAEIIDEVMAEAEKAMRNSQFAIHNC